MLLLEAGAKVGDTSQYCCSWRLEHRRLFTVMLHLEAGAKVGDSSLRGCSWGPEPRYRKLLTVILLSEISGKASSFPDTTKHETS
jgi:hypothetical protein